MATSAIFPTAKAVYSVAKDNLREVGPVDVLISTQVVSGKAFEKHLTKKSN